MRVSSVLILCLALAVPAAARTFTNAEGKTIEAEIESATSTTVTLQLANGGLSTVKLDLLSAADQDHVKTWLQATVPEVRVTPSFVRSNRDPRTKNFSCDEEGDARQIQVLDMSVKLETWDKTRGVPDGEMKYILVGRSMEYRGRYKILAVQTAGFTLPPAGQATVKFKTIQNFYADGQDGGHGARCLGYVLYAKRKSDSREIHASASSPVLEKAIHSIITLETGEETDENFIKTPETTHEQVNKGDTIVVE